MKPSIVHAFAVPVILTVITLAPGTGTSRAETAASVRVAVEAYRTAIAAVKPGGELRALENAYAAVAILSKALTEANDGGVPHIEAMSDEEVAELEKDLPGATISNGEVIGVDATLDYFVKLAAERGDEADRRFFAALKATYPERSLWAIYVEQQTDYSGCTLFGDGKLVQAYRTWSAYIKAFPERYKNDAGSEMKSVTNELTESTCACGGSEAVEKELSQFLQAFPNSPIRDHVAARLIAVQGRTSKIRMNCISG